MPRTAQGQALIGRRAWMSSISPAMDPRQYPIRAPLPMNSSSSALQAKPTCQPSLTVLMRLMNTEYVAGAPQNT